jgi:hypothetical protein
MASTSKDEVIAIQMVQLSQGERRHAARLTTLICVTAFASSAATMVQMQVCTGTPTCKLQIVFSLQLCWQVFMRTMPCKACKAACSIANGRSRSAEQPEHRNFRPKGYVLHYRRGSDGSI